MSLIMRSNPNLLKAAPFANLVAPRAMSGFASFRSMSSAVDVPKGDAIDVINILRTEFMMNNARVKITLPQKEDAWFFV